MDEPELNESAPAPLLPRIAAGLFDAAGWGLVSTVLLLLPLKLGGLALPMWAILAASLVWAIAPLALFRATAGMRFFGLELVSRGGRKVELLDATLRETIGRGAFPLAYLATLGLGLAGRHGGRAEFVFPVGLGLVLLVCALSLLAFAAIGHALVLFRPDRRGLADLLARSMVVARRGQAETASSRRVGGYVGLVAAVLVVLVGLPLLLSGPPPGEPTDQFAERLRRRTLEERFAADPADRAAAEALSESLLAAGDRPAAEHVQARHREALAQRRRVQEASLRARVQESPRDRYGMALLVELLLEDGRVAEAREAYRAWAGAEGTPAARAELGEWLYENGFNEEAARELEAALAAGVSSPVSRAYLGLALVELGRVEEGRRHLRAAKAAEPGLDFGGRLQALEGR